MAKIKNVFICQACGSQATKWLGRCPDCGEWNTLLESEPAERAGDTRRFVPHSGVAQPQRLKDVAMESGHHRPIGMPELDRVLGGGIVPGSVVLLGGDPGIGKSTIILQAAARIAHAKHKVLYVTGEESAAQVRMRAERLEAGDEEQLFILTENSLDAVLNTIREMRPAVTIIDSIQTLYSAQLTAAAGTVGQIREVALQLMYASKSSGMATFLIGHVTKDGMIAGPKVLEHMVDTVLYFEGERGHQYRMLRAVKNRFGSTNEIGVFEMTGAGLRQVANPSALFLEERPAHAAGSVVIAPLEGTRPLLVELQALVAHSGLANPRRTVMGVDTSRVSLLAAVLEKIVGLSLGDQDIFVNVAGGLKVSEPASDLGIVAAMVSSFRNKPLAPRLVMIGEVGLTGEVRAVNGIEQRLAEAAKLGFTQAIIPHSQLRNVLPPELQVTGVKSAHDALECIFA